jgi:hypothetical protein
MTLPPTTSGMRPLRVVRDTAPVMGIAYPTPLPKLSAPLQSSYTVLLRGPASNLEIGFYSKLNPKSPLSSESIGQPNRQHMMPEVESGGQTGRYRIRVHRY